MRASEAIPFWHGTMIFFGGIAQNHDTSTFVFRIYLCRGDFATCDAL